MPIFIGALLTIAFIVGGISGQAVKEIAIGNACLDKHEVIIKGHTFKCERTKFKEGL